MGLMAFVTLACGILVACALPATVSAQYAQQATAEITLIVPANAEVFFDGNPTTQTGARRRYATPPLAVGRIYTYVVLARWQDGGRAVEQTRNVEVNGGASVELEFRARR
jgi:uncharacterized protein (TIGR03000 family)